MAVAEAIGAGVGGANLLYNIFSGISEQRAKKRADKKMGQDINDYQTKTRSILDEQNATNEDFLRRFKENESNYDWENAGKVDFNKDDYDINDYYDQNRAQQLGNTARTAQATAALSGMGRSLGSAQGIASAVADKDSQLSDKAYSRMTQDRQFDYSIAKDSASQQLEALKNKYNASKSIFDLEKSISDEKYGNEQDYNNTILSANLTRHSTI